MSFVCNQLQILPCSGSSDGILSLVNAGARVDAEDKDGLTGTVKNIIITTILNKQKHIWMSVVLG